MTGTVMEVDGTSTENPSAQDIARALAKERADDWYLTLHRGDEGYMDVMIDAGDLWVECEEGGTFLQAKSYVDEEAVKAMLLAFRDGSPGWRDLAAWGPPAPAKKAPPAGLVPIAGVAALVVVALVVTAIATGRGGWIGVLFALVLPGVIAIAAFLKLQEVKRAAAWTKASARIVRSELATETRDGKEVEVPRIEYEFAVGFHRYRAKRVSLGELAGGLQAKAMLRRFSVGAGVPVYYDPADPATRSVLERDLPPSFQAIWIFVAVLTAVIVAGAWWFLLR